MRWAGLVVVLSMMGCDRTCTAGESQACACTDGRRGVQICAENDLYFRACDCSAPVDAGVRPPPQLCSPDISTYLPAPLDRVAVGSRAVVSPTVYSSSGSPDLWVWWTTPSTDAGSSSSTFAFDVPSAGTWTVTGVVSGTCQGQVQPADTVQLRFEAIDVLTLPFALTAFACCDDDGASYLGGRTGEIARFDGVQRTKTVRVSRAVTRLAFSRSKHTLFVLQDARFSAFSVPELQLISDVPVGLNANAVAGDDLTAWLFADDRWVRQQLDAGFGPVATLGRQVRGAIPAEAPDTWVLMLYTSLGIGGPLSDGGWWFSDTQPISCGGVWPGATRGQVLTACQQVLDVLPDGGFGYAGTFATATSSVTGVTALPDGDVFYVKPWSVCGRASGDTLEELDSWKCGFSEGGQHRSAPVGVVPTGDGGAWLLTPSANHEVTWLERAR